MKEDIFSKQDKKNLLVYSLTKNEFKKSAMFLKSAILLLFYPDHSDELGFGSATLIISNENYPSVYCIVRCSVAFSIVFCVIICV